MLNPRPGLVKQPQTSTQHHWQTIIKVAALAYRHRRTRRYGYAFETIDLEGTRLFIGVSTSGRQSVVLTYQEAIVEAMIKAKEVNLSRLIILTNCKRSVQRFNYARVPTWQEQTFVSDTRQLMHQGMTAILFYVPKVIISLVLQPANWSTRFPMHVYNLCMNSIWRLSLFINFLYQYIMFIRYPKTKKRWH